MTGLLARWRSSKKVSVHEHIGSTDIIKTEPNGPWYPFEDGGTLGKPGSENGVTIYDEEHEEGARITLENDGSTAPYTITMGIYGTMFHTHFMGNREEADDHYSGMRRLIEKALQVWDNDDQEPFYKAIEGITERYP